jgi:predicted transcriptional regulator
MMNIQQIEQFCERAGITPVELLRRANVHPSQWSRWKAGLFEPRLKTWRAIEVVMAEIEVAA